MGVGTRSGKSESYDEEAVSIEEVEVRREGGFVFEFGLYESEIIEKARERRSAESGSSREAAEGV